MPWNTVKILSGRILTDGTFRDGYVVIENGIVTEIGEGKAPGDVSAEGIILPGIVDSHTHLGDAGLVLGRRYGLEELVAPPDGLKHRYLRETSDDVLMASMKDYSTSLIESGVSRYMDFREGGERGIRLLRTACPEAFILGRPVSSEYDPNELESLLRTADGIGISSITDMGVHYAESIADAVHRGKKFLAIHVSERIREDIDAVLSLEPDLVVHMVQATDGDMRRCADADVPVSVCTRSNIYFGMIPPVRRMYDAGMRVSAGTDNAMLSSPDIFSEIRTFLGVLKAQGGKPVPALASLIKEGRKLLYQESVMEVGTGNKADLTVIQCSDEREIVSSDDDIGTVRFDSR